LWLRLLSLSNDIETEIRRRLRAQCDITLARFDYLAQLHRHPAGVRMNVLSRFLMVTGGNVTGLTDDLEKDGLVVRGADPDDRRSYRVQLTARGKRTFEKIAREHESWVVELLGGLGASDRELVYELLGQLRVHLSALPTSGSGGKFK
jgi:DNA-binding MarR family transcriptional regulator